MDPLIRKLTEILGEKFTGCEVELESRDGGRIFGFLIWGGFLDIEPIERQGEVWRWLRARLSDEERRRIAAVLTMTPDEMAVARAG